MTSGFCIKHIVDGEMKETMLRESDAFNRYIMHAFGAKGIAMVKMKNAKHFDENARKIVAFHCDEPNPSKTEEKCFLDQSLKKYTFFNKNFNL